jgi:hypothetical protein
MVNDIPGAAGALANFSANAVAKKLRNYCSPQQMREVRGGIWRMTAAASQRRTPGRYLGIAHAEEHPQFCGAHLAISERIDERQNLFKSQAAVGVR